MILIWMVRIVLALGLGLGDVAQAQGTASSSSSSSVTTSSAVPVTVTTSRSTTSILRYDLKKALQLALEKAPSFNSLHHQLQIATLEETTSLTKLLPSLDFSAGHSLLNETPKTANTPWVSELSLTLTENLYDNGVTYTQYKISQLNRKSIEWQVLQNKNKLCLEIITKYLNYSLSTKLLEIREAQHKLLMKQFKNISHFYLQGLKTRRDFLRFKTQVLRSEIDVADLKNDLQKEQEELKILIGIDVDSKTVLEFIPFDFKIASIKLQPMSGLVSSGESSSVILDSWPA